MAEAGGEGATLQTELSVGQRLQAARAAKGLDLRQLSQQTKVTIRHLEAIESGEYDVLPGKPYAIGFSKSYARAVGLDGEEIAEAVRAELREAEPVQPVRVIHQYEIGEAEKTPSSRLTWLAVAVALGVLAAGSFAWRSYYLPAAGLPPVEVPAPQPVSPPAAPQGAPQPATVPAQSDGPVTFTALEDGIWVKFYDGAGNQLLQKQLARGESYTLPAEANGPQIWTGRPEALAITIGGKAVPKLSDVQVTMKDVPVSAAALLARTGAMPPSSPQTLQVAPTVPGAASTVAM